MVLNIVCIHNNYKDNNRACIIYAVSESTNTENHQLLTSGGGYIIKFMPTSLHVKRIIRDNH